MINVKNALEIEKMRKAGKLVARAHKAIEKAIRPGVTTHELDRIVEDLILSSGGIPSFKGYNGFPASICASVNEEVIHGIPSGRKLLDGDIISIDIGAILDGFHGDAAATYPVGKISNEAKRLIDVTKQSFFAGAAQARQGIRLGEISKSVQRTAEDAGYSVVREYVGHGVGRKLHEAPEVPNYYKGTAGMRLISGMTIAIEPMINQGRAAISQKTDNWTIITADGSLSAHYEHTVLVTDSEPELLTVL